MANIMITKRCNLSCPYCFANKFNNIEPVDITPEAFSQAVEFINGAKSEQIGITGGEPMVHPRFRQMLISLINNYMVNDVTIFTNGVFIDRFIDELCHPKFRLEVNCNSPANMGENQYLKMVRNLDLLIAERYMKSKVTLSINIYKPDFEYDYILELLKRYRFNTLRVSIAVPNVDKKRNINALEYFKALKPRIKEFFQKLFKINVIPSYNCNAMPSCLITSEERHLLSSLDKVRERSNIADEVTKCDPVIDILPDLTAARCFGLSEYERVNISDFKNISEIKYYFMTRFDAYAYNVCSSPLCADCHQRKVTKCNGGCFAFKIADILKMQSKSDDLINVL